MSDRADKHGEDVFAARVGANAARKQRAQRAGDQGVWFGLGMSGLIGWSVGARRSCRCLAGHSASAGVFLDTYSPLRRPDPRMFQRVALGCAAKRVNAR